MAARATKLLRGRKVRRGLFHIKLFVILITVPAIVAPASSLRDMPLVNPVPLVAPGVPAPALQIQPAPKACPADHTVKTFATKYQGRTFHVTRLPRCLHIEMVIANNPAGETKEQAEKRLGGVAICSGSFHHPRTLSIADFLQSNGEVIQDPTTSRWFVVVTQAGTVDISNNYTQFKGKPGISALALGQRLVPLHRDGFSHAFMKQVTDRMAIGLTDDYIFVVETKSDIYQLASFVKNQLHCTAAVNSDGGHVVHGKAPVHIVFRWRNLPLQPIVTAEATPPAKQGAS
jgi:hypothetical protein